MSMNSTVSNKFIGLGFVYSVGSGISCRGC
jgi:hypothetical protein